MLFILILGCIFIFLTSLAGLYSCEFHAEPKGNFSQITELDPKFLTKVTNQL